jgi:hypothetical protein
MPFPYYTSPLAVDGTYEQWTLICDSDGKRVRYQKLRDLVGEPTVLSSTDIPLAEFLGSNESLAKTRLQTLLDGC